MIKLYGGARSRASIVHWYLEELQIPYEFIKLDMSQGEHLKDPYLQINPMGKVPGIVDGDFTLWESGAILVYLAQKYGNLSSDPEDLARVNQWVLFANSTLSSSLMSEENRTSQLPRLLQTLDSLLSHHTFMTGDHFSIADISVGAVLCYMPMMFKIDLSSYPHVTSYVQQLSQRPAFQKTIGQRGG